MVVIGTEQIKALREETGVSIMQCKKALEEAEGDMEKAKVILRKLSSSIAGKKADRTLGAGVVAAYTHAGGSVVGAVVLMTETDFVSKNEGFAKLAYDIAMHVAAMKPQFRSREDVHDSDIKAAREVFEKEVEKIAGPARERALMGKLESYLAERVLLEQPFVKDSSITVRQLIEQAVQKFGEKIEVVRFERLSVR
ncbi:MAG: Elongation factor Ts [Candidatus Kaiserbacteria bacterium GW2011_GWB1_52_6]|uniref:Elongation factor Ts n=3 Tax=Candidatus Kaiseribacteriota TaxID=1752734 RepID=A0A0G1XL51_9BACT|nr:MAG: Elongation factor Ts [Candidatus Kaiserbacteria bacterium GW2011_GWA2_52_12]KKW27342.1 MAG: Elongation factor Ts [Candidatus Kaiserbacteria bacterium GW2011_GWB1_52_6]KKW31596.1 MAG: Elongation factor Ts [Candidatus Kaiserbacteria bacterium GW2011_GWC2_52_8b]